MKEITSFDDWEEIRTRQNSFLLFVKTNHCSVCEGLRPQVEALETDDTFPFYLVNAAETPEMAGQLSLFTAPVVLLFSEGREYARFARFVQMDELKRRIKELMEGRNLVD